MADTAPAPFSTKIVAAVVVAAVLAFLGYLFLSAYAPQLKVRSGHGTHPMSKSAVGFYGFYRLAESTGRLVHLVEREEEWGATGLEIVTIDLDTDPDRLRTLVTRRRAVANSKTLYILPKWLAVPQFGNPIWVQSFGPIEDVPPKLYAVFGPFGVDGVANKSGGRIHGLPGGELADVSVAAPKSLHFLTGTKPVLIDDLGRIVLGRSDFPNGASDYILADPDLLSNQGMKSPETAFAALKIVDSLRASTTDSIAFDVALNGLAGGRNLLQLMFEPPFLALTLAVLVAAGLAGIHAFGRFGPPVAEPRAIPFGKRALADNAAMLIARARAVRRMGDRYVALTRDAVAATLGAASMETAALERWLAALPGVRGPDFGALAADARKASDSEAVRAAAQALHNWRNEVTRDR